jgi:hypothetical protein
MKQNHQSTGATNTGKDENSSALLFPSFPVVDSFI